MILIPKPGFLIQPFSTKISRPKPALNLAEVEAVLAHYELGRWQAGRALAGGNSYNLGLQTGHGKKILKKYHWSLPSTRQEHSILGHLAGTDFPTPALVFNRAGLTYTEVGQAHYAIYDFVEGYNYNNYFMPARTRQRLIAQAGETLAHFHQLMAGFRPEGRKFNGFKPGEERLWRDVLWHLDVLEQYVAQTGPKKSLDELDEFLLSIIDEIRLELIEVGRFFEHPDPQLPKVVIHGDYSPQNILFNRQKLAAVLDFGDACLNLRALDVARGLTSFAHTRGHDVDSRLAGLFLQAYQARQPLFKPEIEAIPDLIRWRYLQNIIWPLLRLRQGRKSPEAHLSFIRNKWQAAGWMKRHGDELRSFLLSAS